MCLNLSALARSSVHGHWDDIRRGKTSNRLDFPLWQRGSCEDWGSSVKRDDRQHISQYLPEYGQEIAAQLWAGGALRRNAGDYGLQPRNRQVSADNLFPDIQGTLRLYAVWHHSNENSERYDRGWKGSFNVFKENDGINLTRTWNEIFCSRQVRMFFVPRFAFGSNSIDKRKFTVI